METNQLDKIILGSIRKVKGIDRDYCTHVVITKVSESGKMYFFEWVDNSKNNLAQNKWVSENVLQQITEPV